MFAARGDFQKAKELFDRLAQLVDQIAQGPPGELYRLELIRTTHEGQTRLACPALRICWDRLLAAEPYCGYCPNCYRVNSPGLRATCKACGGRSWTTRAAFERCSPSEQQHVLNLWNTRAE
jgi:hypothetical protein